MNTHNHESIAKDAGLPLLGEIFGLNEPSLNAFYLGNWLTDVSQAVDPVAYASGSKEAKKLIENLKKSILNFMEDLIATTFLYSGGTMVSMKEALRVHADNASKDLLEQIKYFVAFQGSERNSRLAKFFRSSFLVIGYFKFVHPNAPNQKPRMDFECFMRVFGRPNDSRGAKHASPAIDRSGAYTQYYPYHHLDRPEILPTRDPPIFAPGYQDRSRPFQVAPGKRPGTRSPRCKERIVPDLYSYLRDDIEITAGLLAEVDKAFEQAFGKFGNKVKSNDPLWHITLAKLGHALHQVEDFFAHSNWIELAAKSMGADYLKKSIPPTTPFAFMDKFNTTYQKRLKRYLTKPLSNWRNHPDEDWVVTGYFDFQDTLISLAHISEELWGGNVPDPWAQTHDIHRIAKEKVQKPKTTLYEAQQTMKSTLDFITDPQKALQDRDNKIAQSLKEKFEPDINILQRPGVSRKVAEEVAREVSFLRDSPKEVKEAFFTAIVEGTRTYKSGKTIISIYKTIKTIADFFTNPLDWLLDFLPEWLKEKMEDAITFYVKELFYEWIGSGRIGCHSLIAKDHGLEPFFKQQKECATAVHWYIMSNLLRWWHVTENPGYIDWLKLLEYFLRNPLPPNKSSFREVKFILSVTLVHNVEGGEQLSRADKNPRFSLEHKYKATAVRGTPFNWRTIADANFNTGQLSEKDAQRVINQVLKNAGGVPVALPNYALRKGMKVLIPNQTIESRFRAPIKRDPTWFEAVLNKDWKVFVGYEDPKLGVPIPPLEHHTPKKIKLDELDKIILRGKHLRLMARQAYRPYR